MKKIFMICLAASFLLAGCHSDSSDNSTDTPISDSTIEESSTPYEDPSSSTQTSSLSSSNHSSTSSTEQQTADTVSSSEFGGYATFYFNGMNVPDSININTNTDQITFNVDTSNEAIYTLSMQNIPAKTIRIFSAHTNEIRTVIVSTKLSIGDQLSGTFNSNNQSGDLYLFHNKQGGLSLATPNYAGNVSENETDVMLEVLQ
ncbi:hypothetical protein [Enterococcus sp. AZ196]|uniref:hypothetical protein n=1 Tax=Enterococcus sp. AZ196 TaxID=2774659 RepID=UPI003D29C7AB